MPKVDLGDLTIGYDDIGEGPPLLAVQGLGFARWGWSRQEPDLGKRFRLIAPDTRGIGGSPDPEGPRSVAQLAHDFLRFLDALGLDRVHVMGASAGGFVALEMALTAPERIDRLVLVCTAGTGDWEIIAEPSIAIFNALGIGPDPEPDPSLEEAERVRWSVRTMFSETFGQAHPEVLDQIIAWRAETAQPPVAWLAHFRSGLAFDRRDRLAEIAAPTLVIHGDEDRVVRLDAGRALAGSIPGARFELFTGAGHIVFMEEAEAFNDLVAGFLEAR